MYLIIVEQQSNKVVCDSKHSNGKIDWNQRDINDSSDSAANSETRQNKSHYDRCIRIFMVVC